jgi:hypothetical protein
MSTLPRTPVHFPRMKVRGHRNKAKLAARIESRSVFPHATVTRTADGRYTVRAQAGPIAGVLMHRIEYSEWRDGYGRHVPAPRPKPKPKPKPQFSMSFSFKQTAEQRAALDSIFGG